MGYYFALAQIGLEMVLPVVRAGISSIDWLDTIPWITWSLVVLGFVGGLIHLISDPPAQKERDEFAARNRRHENACSLFIAGALALRRGGSGVPAT